MRAEEKALGLSRSELDTPQESVAEEEDHEDEQADAGNADVDDGSTDDDSLSEADQVLAAAVQESLNMHGANGDSLESKAESPADLAEETLIKQEDAPISDHEEGDVQAVPEAKKEPEMSKKDKRRLKEAKKKAEAEAAEKSGTVSGQVRLARIATLNNRPRYRPLSLATSVATAFLLARSSSIMSKRKDMH